MSLKQTMQDAESLYILMDPVMGGELFSHLCMDGPFSEHDARFYAACAIEALASLHANGCVLEKKGNRCLATGLQIGSCPTRNVVSDSPLSLLARGRNLSLRRGRSQVRVPRPEAGEHDGVGGERVPQAE